MDSFDGFDPFEGDVPGYPMFEVPGIAWEARKLLTGCTLDDVIELESVIDACVTDMQSAWVHSELDDLAVEVLENRLQEIVGFLPDSSKPTLADVRRRLDNWPRDAECPFLLPSEDDLTGAEALRMAFMCGAVPVEVDAAQCFAVFCLMHVAEYAQTVVAPDSDWEGIEGSIDVARMVNAGNKAVDAAIALRLAAVFDAEAAGQRDDVAAQQEFNAERARTAARARHAANADARRWVLSEWVAHRDTYGGNKSEFARHYAARCMNERGVRVSDKQIRDVWLRDLAAARDAQ